jgi:hypothetical protein
LAELLVIMWIGYKKIDNHNHIKSEKINKSANLIRKKRKK